MDPFALTVMNVAPFAAAKWWACAGMDPESPTCIGLAFAASNVSPMPTRSVPFLTVTVSAVDGSGAGLVAGWEPEFDLNGAALVGSPLNTGHLGAQGKHRRAELQCSALGVAGAAWE